MVRLKRNIFSLCINSITTSIKWLTKAQINIMPPAAGLKCIVVISLCCCCVLFCLCVRRECESFAPSSKSQLVNLLHELYCLNIAFLYTTGFVGTVTHNYMGAVQVVILGGLGKESLFHFIFLRYYCI